MGRAFREGVAPERRVVTQKRDLRFELAIGDGRLSHLWNRATKSQQASNPDGQVPAMLTIEDDQWVWQQVSPDVLAAMSHRLVLHQTNGQHTLGCTPDFKTACAYANHLAETENKVVLIEPL